MIAFEARALTVLYHVLSSLPLPKKTFLMPANVCPEVPLLFLKANVPFELVDISSDTLCIDRGRVTDVLEKARDRYAGLIFVRTYGVTDSFRELFSEIKQIAPELILIDDCCLCPPTAANPDLTDRDIVLYSTGHAKLVDLGFGGFAFLRDTIPYQRRTLVFERPALLQMTDIYKITIKRNEQFCYADSAWLDTEAPMVSWEDYVKLVSAELEWTLLHKESLNRLYTENLPAEIQLDSRFQAWRFNILVPEKTKLLSRIFEAGLFASDHYASLAGIFGDADAPIAKSLHKRVVNLFNDHYFNAGQAEQMIQIIQDHLKSSTS